MLAKIRYSNGDIFFADNIKTFLLQYENNRLILDDCPIRGLFYRTAIGDLTPEEEDNLLQLSNHIIERIVINDELVYSRTEVSEWD